MTIPPKSHTDHYRRIRQDPKFIALSRARGRTSWWLTIVVLSGYFLFMGVAASDPQLLHRPLYPSSHISLGIPLGALLIVAGWLLTGWYVHRANNHYDRLNESIIQESQE